MRRIRVAICLAALAVPPAHATYEDAGDWEMFSRVLALVQPIVHLAAHSPDPQAARKAIDAMLAGGDERANRIASDLLDEALRDVPSRHRPVLRSLASDVLALARREQQARPAFDSHPEALERAIRARKELHAMGLRYWDEQQFREAQARGDAIAVELFLAARGLRNPPAAH
jgi:hypothetical protein